MVNLPDVIGISLTISIIAFLLIVNEGTVDWKQFREAKRNYKEHLKNLKPGEAHDGYLQSIYVRSLPPKRFYVKRYFLLLLFIGGMAALAWLILSNGH